MYQFDNPYFLYISLIIPLVIMIYFFYMSWRKKIQKSFSNKELLDYISPNRSNFKLNLKLVLESLVILLLSIALANPKIGTELKFEVHITWAKHPGVSHLSAVDFSTWSSSWVRALRGRCVWVSTKYQLWYGQSTN